MAGFTSNDNMISNVSASGKQYSAPFTKQFNPTAAAVANEWHTLFRGGGQPQADAIFDVGTNLQFQSVYDVTTSAGCIQHGGNIGATGADFKTLMSAYAVTAASTVVPFTIQLVDVLAFIWHKEDENTHEFSDSSLIVAKHRNGPVGEIPVVFLRDKTEFASAVRVATPKIY
jgi:replicative DNA helicase